MRIAAVSPHLDDAALSASARLTGSGATVVTVFTALPPAGLDAGWWDRVTGATSSMARQQERLAEDHAAMRVLGAHAVHLAEPDAQYRNGAPDLENAVRSLTREFARCDEVWLPSAIGGHRDHRAARDAGLRAAMAAGHTEVVLYADFPYVIAYGWPGWATGEPADPYLDAAYWLADQLRAVGLDPAALTPAVTRLTAAQRLLKSDVIAAYRSQAPALRLSQADLDREPAKLDYELSWRVPLPGAAAGPGRRSRLIGIGSQRAPRGPQPGRTARADIIRPSDPPRSQRASRAARAAGSGGRAGSEPSASGIGASFATSTTGIATSR